MKPTLTARIERFPVAGVFNISRGAKTHVDVVLAEITLGGVTGRGEATAIYYHGETAESVCAQILEQSSAIADGASREDLLRLMPRGAARNALDAALWDLEAKRSGQPVWQLAGLAEPKPLVTAYTISLADPASMENAARAAAAKAYPLLKLKLSGEGDLDRVAAVRRGAPDARLIVDANEAWTGRDIMAEAHALAAFGVELIEQPVRAGEDRLLDGIAAPIPLCADESCQDRSDLKRCAGRYQVINIKLDKAGGLTEALALAKAARERGLDLMIGCMLSTSLGVAPAFLAGQQARWVDLDGPLLLAEDRPDPVRFEGAVMHPPPRALWG